MAMYEDPELENEESTSGGNNPSFTGGGGLGSAIGKEVRRELVQEAVGFIRDLFFGGDDD